MSLWYQCALAQGERRTVGWIEERGAKEGCQVELKGEDGLWRVLRVFSPAYDASWLDEKRRKDRGSLPSLVRA